MTTYWLGIVPLSDVCFGRGDGVAGSIDLEVQHDRHGHPFLGGKALKGMLCATCAEILDALERSAPDAARRWEGAAERLFGTPGSGHSAAAMHVGAAELPEDLRGEVAHQDLPAREVLELLTTTRRQTAMDQVTGAPLDRTLRSVRLVIRETPFAAPLEFQSEPQEEDLQLLAACAKGLRRVGTGRNRGWGRCRIDLYGRPPFALEQEEAPEPLTQQLFEGFQQRTVAT